MKPRVKQTPQGGFDDIGAKCVHPETTFRSSGAKAILSDRLSYRHLATLWPGLFDRTL
jgi:hypothetical protein